MSFSQRFHCTRINHNYTRTETRLVSELVVWWLIKGDLWDLKIRSIIDDLERLETVGAGVLDQLLAGFNRLCSLGTESLSMPVLLVLNARETTSC